jgi:hypothetical protein
VDYLAPNKGGKDGGSAALENAWRFPLSLPARRLENKTVKDVRRQNVKDVLELYTVFWLEWDTQLSRYIFL